LIFLQDETAGIAVGMPEGPVVRRGDSLWVKGVIQQQFGLTRIEGVQYGRVNVLTRYPEPIPLTVSAAASEVYEGQLVEVRGRVVSNQMNEGGQFVLLADPVPYAEARVTIFVPRRRLDEVSLDRFESGDRVAVTGVLSQYDREAPYTASYQVLPRDPRDLDGNAEDGHYRTVILVLVGGALLAVVVVLTLRSVIRRRTQQLVESRARFRRLAEATTEGIILHRDGDILDVNRALTDMMGYDRQELMGRSFQSVLSHSTRESEWEELRTATEPPTEVVLVREDGSSFPAEIDERVVTAAEQRARVAAIRDITEQKRRETELVEAKEEAEEMARLKSSLLNNMSHEFRTPITSILGYAEVILEEPDADHEPFALHIRRSGQRLSRTLQAVLEMAQLEAGTTQVTPEDVEVGPVVREVVREYSGAPGAEEVSVQVDVSTSCVLQTDRQLVRRIVENLVHNAIKFTHNGEVTVAVQAHDATAVITVADSGNGIPPAFRDHLFTPFKQASEGRTRTHEGVGLGLALTKRMLDLLGGDIDVDSEEGVGTTVVVTLPDEGEAGGADRGQSDNGSMSSVVGA
jgi:PAS domain S-box-containing protein